MKTRSLNTVVFIISLLIAGSGCAVSTTTPAFADRSGFLKEIFEGPPPQPSHIWITPDMRSEIESVLGRSYPVLRIPYRRENGKTVWILQDTIKNQALTVGIVIHRGQIIRMETLSGGSPHSRRLRNNAFTRQFINSGLNGNDKLDKTIDAVSGATYSSNTVSRLAQLALMINKQLEQQ
ncbi:MAG: FMN-binding protein [Desulfobacteraceae bacterium]|nr:FMN-binding protein [Desulfobacteraceae bacterium]